MGDACSHCAENASSASALHNADFWEHTKCAGIGEGNKPQLVVSKFDLGTKLAEMHGSKHVKSFLSVQQRFWEGQGAEMLFCHVFTIVELDDDWFVCVERYNGQLELIVGKGSKAFRSMYRFRATGDERCHRLCFPPFSEDCRQGLEVGSDVSFWDVLQWLDGSCAKRWQAYDLWTAHSPKFAEELQNVLKCGRTEKFLPNDARAVLQAVKENGVALERAPEVLRSDRSTVLAAVSRDGLALEFVSTDLQGDIEITRAAVNQNKFAFHYASQGIQANAGIRRLVNLPPVEYASDYKSMMEALKANQWALKYASPDLLRNLKFMKEAIVVRLESLAHASPELYAALGEHWNSIVQQFSQQSAARRIAAKHTLREAGGSELDEQRCGPTGPMQTDIGLGSKGLTNSEVAAVGAGRIRHETPGSDLASHGFLTLVPAVEETGILRGEAGLDFDNKRCPQDSAQSESPSRSPGSPDLEAQDTQQMAKDTGQTQAASDIEADRCCTRHVKLKVGIGCLLLFVVLACLAVLIILLTRKTSEVTASPTIPGTSLSANWPADQLSNGTFPTTTSTGTSLTKTSTSWPAELNTTTQTMSTRSTTYATATDTSSNTSTTSTAELNITTTATAR